MALSIGEGTTVLVTGASSGIGAALAPALAEHGATVGVVARRAERLDEVLARCEAAAPGAGHRAWPCDLGDLEAAGALALEAWDAFGHLDVLVNNAAIPKRRRVQELTNDEVEHLMRVNYLSPVRMSLAVLPRMLERDRGVIVNVSSIGGRLGIAGEAAYCGTKFALNGFSEAMAVDLWDTGVDVRIILPGAIATEIWDQPDNDDPLYEGPFETPESVAADIIAAIEADSIEKYTPDMKAIIEYKTSDIDDFLSGVADMSRAKARADSDAPAKNA